MGKWIGTITNIGVIIGLVLVAYQIQQTNVALERETKEWDTELSFSYNEMWHNFATLLIENAGVWELGLRSAELSEAEKTIFGAIGKQWVWVWFQTYKASLLRGENTNWIFRSVAKQIQESPGLAAVFENWIEENGVRRDAPFVADILALM